MKKPYTKKPYTKKQITEAISYWESQLAEGNYRKVDEGEEYRNFDELLAKAGWRVDEITEIDAENYGEQYTRGEEEFDDELESVRQARGVIAHSVEDDVITFCVFRGGDPSHYAVYR